MLFRAEIAISGANAHEQRFRLAETLRRMAESVTLSSRTPIDVSERPHSISTAGGIVGSYFFDEGLKPPQRAA
jgi:hypothetical protein